MIEKYRENKLDKMFQELSHNKLCAICGKVANAIHHIVGRANTYLRWDKQNSLPVCVPCHIKIHDGQVNVYNFISEDRIKYLENNRNVVFKPDDIFYKQKEKELR